MGKWAEIIRTSFAAGDAERDKGLGTPENIVRYDNIVYGTDETWQVLDVYRRKEDEGKVLPVIVIVHGGGWVYGDKEGYQFYGMDLAQRGFAVVSFSYRLAPEAPHPAPVEDTNLVFTWVMEHAAEYGLDTGHIFAAGDSAGAHILAIYLDILTNPEYAKNYDLRTPDGLKIQADALNCGEYKVVFDDPSINDMMEGLMAEYLPGGGTEEELQLVSPADYVTEDFPPTFLMSASEDFLRAQAPVMAAQLTAGKVPFTYKFYGSAAHPLAHVFHLDIRSEDAKVCIDEECEFFRGFLA